MAIHELAAALPSAAELADLRESDIDADADAWISALRMRLGDDPRPGAVTDAYPRGAGHRARRRGHLQTRVRL